MEKWMQEIADRRAAEKKEYIADLVGELRKKLTDAIDALNDAGPGTLEKTLTQIADAVWSTVIEIDENCEGEPDLEKVFHRAIEYCHVRVECTFCQTEHYLNLREQNCNYAIVVCPPGWYRTRDDELICDKCVATKPTAEILDKFLIKPEVE